MKVTFFFFSFMMHSLSRILHCRKHLACHVIPLFYFTLHSFLLHSLALYHYGFLLLQTGTLNSDPVIPEEIFCQPLN